MSHPTPDGIAGKRFRLVRRLGEGGMGVVYEALDTERNARVALKTVRTMTAESLARFKREFRAVQDVHHPNLATIGELVSEADRLFFTMELVEGTDFIGHVCPDVSSFGDDAPSSEQASTRALGFASTRRIALGPLERPPRFDDRRLRAAMAQLAQGLVALHEAGLVHRDIKPSNIRVTGEGRVVLLDFGLVSDVSSNRDTTDHNVVGTPAYMAPEQAASKPVGPAADWYSVGILLYEVFTGSPPFEGPPLEVLLRKQQREPPAPSTLSRHVPTDLDELCTALLRFDPEARPTGAQVLRMLGVPVASPAMRSHSQTANFPFVGRAPELDTLADAYGDSRRGAVSVLIRGESGVGKSCLVKRFVDVLSLEQNDLVVLSGRCYEREAVPYKALDGIVDALTRFLKRLPAAECSGLTPTKPGPLVQLFPVLRRVGAIASQTKNMAPPVLDPLELRSRAFAALREMLTRLADRRALVLVIDDLQWAGADSLALLADVLRPPEAPNVLLVATVRTSGGDAPRDALLPGDVRSVDLGRLSPQQALELTTLLLQRAGTASAADADAIVAEAEGHPLFIDALVRHAMLDEGEKLGTVYLEEALWSRVRLLEVPTRRLMELLACAGAPIEQDVLSAASDSDRDDFAQQIAFLRVAHLASISGGRGSDTIEPYHDKVRAAVVANLDEATRRDCHRRLAIALETSTRADPEALASHWQRAGEPVRGAKYAIRAAEQASESLAFDRAANLYALALELTPREDPERRALSEKLGEAFGNAGRGALAAAAYRDAAQGASAAHALDLRRRAAEQLLRGGHFEEGMTAIGEVLASIGLALPSSPFAALMWLLLWRLYLRIRGLRFRERDPGQVTANELTRSDVCWSVANAMSFADHIVGAAYQGRAVVLALRSGDPYRIARALALEIGYVGAGGGPSWRRTQSLIRHAKTLAESSGRPDAIAWVEGATGLAFQLVGRYPESLRHLARSREIILGQCSGMAWEIDTLQYLELNDLTYMGEIAELCRLAPKYLRDAIDRGDRYGALNMSTGAPNIRWLVVDDPAAARNEVAEAMRKWPSQGFHVEHFNEFVALTLADVYADRAGDAYQRFVERWPALVRSQLLRVQAIAIVLHHMRALAAIARAERGSEPRSPLLMVAARDARAILRTKMPLAVVVGNLVLAGVEVVRGARGRERAVAALREAMRVGDDHSMHLWSTPARRSLGLLLGGDEGAELVRSADARLAAQGVKHPERMCTAFAPGFSRLM